MPRVQFDDYVSQQGTSAGSEPIHPLDDSNAKRGVAADAAIQGAQGFNRGLENAYYLPNHLVNAAARALGYNAPLSTPQLSTRFNLGGTREGETPSTDVGRYAGAVGEVAGGSVLPYAGLTRAGLTAATWPTLGREAASTLGAGTAAQYARDKDLGPVGETAAGLLGGTFAYNPVASTNYLRNFVAEHAPGPNQLNTFASADRAAKDPFYGDPQRSDLPQMIAEARMRRNMSPEEANPGARENPAIFKATSGGGVDVAQNHPPVPLPGLAYSPEGALRMEIPAGSVDMNKVKAGNDMPFQEAYSSDAFRLYPDLGAKRMYVTTDRTPNDLPENIEHPTDPNGFTISVYNKGAKPNPDLIKAYMEKRLQYLIDQKEGFAQGAKHALSGEAPRIDALDKRLSGIRQNLQQQLQDHDSAIAKYTDLQQRYPGDSFVPNRLDELRNSRAETAANLDAVGAYHDHIRGFNDDVRDAQAASGDPSLSNVLSDYVANKKAAYTNNGKVPPARLDKPLNDFETKKAISDYLYSRSAGHIMSELASRRANWPGAGVDYPFTQDRKYPLAANPNVKRTSPDIEHLNNALVTPPANLSPEEMIDFAKRWRFQGNGRKF